MRDLVPISRFPPWAAGIAGISGSLRVPQGSPSSFGQFFLSNDGKGMLQNGEPWLNKCCRRDSWSAVRVCRGGVPPTVPERAWGLRGGRPALLREAAGAGEGVAFTPPDFCRGKRLWSCPGAPLQLKPSPFLATPPSPLFFILILSCFPPFFLFFPPVLSSSNEARFSRPPRSARSTGAAGGESSPAPRPRPRALSKKKRVLTLTRKRPRRGASPLPGDRDCCAVTRGGGDAPPGQPRSPTAGQVRGGLSAASPAAPALGAPSSIPAVLLGEHRALSPCKPAGER